MKRLIVFIFFTITSFQLFGQIQAYLKTGVTATTCILKRKSIPSGDTSFVYNSALIRPNFGFGLEKDFYNNKVKVMVGLELITRGYRDNTTQGFPGFPSGQITNMISLPILIGYNINQRFTILGGVTLGQTIWKNKNYAYFNDQFEGFSIYNVYSHGLNLGVEYNLKGFKIGMDYYQTLNSFLKDNKEIPGIVYKGFYRTGQIYVRYNFTSKVRE